MTKGYELLARSLSDRGVTHVFTVSGTPVLETLSACVSVGIRVIGARNEQGALMMALAQNYVTGCLSSAAILASGPAVTNALTGIYIARENRWPLLVLGGCSDRSLQGMGAFQELDAVPVFQPLTKWSAAVEQVEELPAALARACEVAFSGVPGAVYLDLPENVLLGTAQIAAEKHHKPHPTTPEPERTIDKSEIRQAAELLLAAKRPMMIVGEDIRWSEPVSELRELVEQLNIPYITSPMGRGFLPDDLPQCQSAARAAIQAQADTVLLVGARLNWFFRFGRDLAADARIIQICLDANDISFNRQAEIGLAGNIRETIKLLVEVCRAKLSAKHEWDNGNWLSALNETRSANEDRIAPLLNSDAIPMTPHRLMREVRDFAERDSMIVVDGNLILGTARQVLPSYLPASRLNCGATGCVGVGVPFGIGAKLAQPQREVIAICGDSAFGFSAMEMETAVRCRVPVIIVVANNDGIGGNRTQRKYFPADHPDGVATYVPGIHYEKIMQAFGGHYEYVSEPNEVAGALARARASGVAACINVVIESDTYIDE